MATVSFRRRKAGTWIECQKVVACPICLDRGLLSTGEHHAYVVHEREIYESGAERDAAYCRVELPTAFPFYADAHVEHWFRELARRVAKVPHPHDAADQRPKNLASFALFAREAVKRGLLAPPGVAHAVEVHLEERERRLQEELDRARQFAAEARREVNELVRGLPMPGRDAEGDGA
jgi:hypothetical protein